MDIKRSTDDNTENKEMQFKLFKNNICLFIYYCT